MSLQSWPSFGDLMDHSPRGSCLWDSPCKNTGVGCHALLRRLFPTQGLVPRLFARSALAAGFSTISTTREARLPAVCVQLRSRVRLFVTPWTVACQAPLSVGFSRQEQWSGLPFLIPGDLPDPWIKPTSRASSAMASDPLPLVPPGKPFICYRSAQIVYFFLSPFLFMLF